MKNWKLVSAVADGIGVVAIVLKIMGIVPYHWGIVVSPLIVGFIIDLFLIRNLGVWGIRARF